MFTQSACCSVAKEKKHKAEETSRDPTLSKVMEALINNQPLISQYEPYSSELSVIGGLLFKGVAIPKTC